MAGPDIAGAPVGYNARITAAGYGSRLLRCLRVSYGVQVNTTDDEAASARATYPLARVIPSFTLVVSLHTLAERDAFNAWVREYMRQVTTNQRVSGYMNVTVPSRNFSRSGVPVGPLTYGARSGDFWWPTQISFVGVTDPVSAVGASTVPGASRYVGPSKDTTDAPYFYPAGTQKAGAESLEGTFFDPRPSTPSSDEVAEVAPYEQSPRFGPVPR